ncbi:MAG: menaquinone biosynthesis protein [Bacteroidetes bacterium]|nr:menaquinone biosynthesis protein [Bacteroidota bacterium]
MKKSSLRISAVSYINAKPFVYGIEQGGFLKNYSLSLDIPSLCADKLMKDKVDIGLAPIAVIPHLKKYFLFPDFCIGANGPVRSVMLYSEAPLNEIKRIHLDNQSRTSVMLLQILAKHFWKISPQWIQAKDGYEKNINGNVAGLIIGDRNFSFTKKFQYAFDLSEQWKLFTGLPFVFACWISNKKLDAQHEISFYKSMKFGLEQKEKVIEQLDKEFDKKIMSDYLNEYIIYSLDQPKRIAMNLFLKLCATIR